MPKNQPNDPTIQLMNPIWNTFAAPEADNSIVAYDYVEYRNDNINIATAGDVQTVFNYVIRSKDLDSYLVPNQSYLSLKFKITADGSGTPLDNVDESDTIVSLINGGMNLFKDAEYHMNGNLIERVDEPGIAQIMDGVRMMSKDMAESVSQMEWFYPEKATKRFGDAALPQADVRLVTKLAGAANLQQYEAGGTNDFPARNHSFAMRFDRTKFSQGVELIIPLARIFGFCRDVPYAFRGMTHMVRLNKNQEYDRILHGRVDSAANAQTVITELSMWMPRAIPSVMTASMLEQQLAKDTLTKYLFENMTVYTSDEYTTNNATWKVTTTTHKPTLALVGFQVEAQYNNKQDVSFPPANQGEINNGGIFTKFFGGDITKVEVRVNSKIIPHETYQISFSDANPDYTRAYQDLLRSGGKWAGDNDGLVSYEDFKDLYPIFAFDMSHADDVYANVKQNDIEIRWTVDPAGLTYRAYCTLYSEQEMEVKALDGRLQVRV